MKVGDKVRIKPEAIETSVLIPLYQTIIYSYMLQMKQDFAYITKIYSDGTYCLGIDLKSTNSAFKPEDLILLESSINLNYLIL